METYATDVKDNVMAAKNKQSVIKIWSITRRNSIYDRQRPQTGMKVVNPARTTLVWLSWISRQTTSTNMSASWSTSTTVSDLKLGLDANSQATRQMIASVCYDTSKVKTRKRRMVMVMMMMMMMMMGWEEHDNNTKIKLIGIWMSHNKRIIAAVIGNIISNGCGHSLGK